MRQMMSLSLLQQQSATARLQGVVSIAQIDDPSGDVIAALLDTLMYDPNANVRLATIDALKRFMDRDSSSAERSTPCHAKRRRWCRLR